MGNSFLTFVITMLLGTTALGQSWTSHTDFKPARRLLYLTNSSSLWGATPGGAFEFSCADTMLTKHYTNSDGLPQIEVNDLAADSLGRIWFGTNGGGLARLDPTSSLWYYCGLIDGLISDTVTALYCHGSYVFAGSPMGLSIFNGNSWQAFLMAQIFPQGNIINCLSVHGDTLWVGTDVGLAKSALADIANHISAWKRDSLVSQNSRNVLSLCLTDTLVLVGTASGAARFNGILWSAIAELNGLAVRSILQTKDSLLFATNNGVRLSDHGIWSDISAGLPTGQTHSLVKDGSGRIWCGTEQGIALKTSVSWQWHKFNCLQTNSCFRIASDRNGNPYVVDQSKTIISYLDNGRWNFYTPITTGMPFSDLRRVALDKDGSFYAGDWGQGLFVRNSTGAWKQYSYPNPLPAQTIADILTTDSGVYLAQWGYTYRDPLCFYSYSDSLFHPIWGPVETLRPNALALNHEGTLFVGTNELGLYIYSPVGSWRNYNRSNSGLPSNTVLSLACKNQGELWIGTTNGLAIWQDSIIRPVTHSLLSRTINSIKVDRSNNTWIGTDNGLNLITWDNRLFSFTTQNSMLLDNQINEISISPDDDSGDRIMVATNKGLNIIYYNSTGTGARPYIDLAPNPFRPGRDPYFYFYNLPSQATIRIFTLNGRLLGSFRGPSSPAHILTIREKDLGTRLVSGLYLCHIAAPGCKSDIIKLTVVR